MLRYLALTGLIILVFVFIYQFFGKKSQTEVNVKIKDTDYKLEIASTPAQKAKGLSGRSSLCPQCGMLFIFSSDAIQTFWMKDTLIPLDMIFLDSKGTVVTIHTARPEPGLPLHELTTYSSTAPARYVIELNANQSQKIGLNVGDTISLPQL